MFYNTLAQDIPRHVAISAYIYNFAKNITWKNEDSIASFHILIVGKEEKLLNELNQLAKTRKLKNKNIIISQTTSISSLENVQLVYLVKGKEENLKEIYYAIEGKNILLISDSYKDKRKIMINFFDSNDETLKFEINKPNIINQQLFIMPDVIFAGGTEVDVAALYQEGVQNLRALQKHTDNLESNYLALEAEIKKKQSLIQNLTDSLEKQNAKVLSKQQILESQNELIKKQANDLLFLNKKIADQQKLFELGKKELQNQLKEWEEGKKKLELQKEAIKWQNQEIETQKNKLLFLQQELETQEQKINKQQNLVLFLVIIIILVGIIIVFIYRNYQAKIQHNKILEKKVVERTKKLHLLNAKLNAELEERIQAEMLIKELNKDLENRVEKRTQQLIEINKELESYSYSISHDLRAPLRAIFGFSQILSKRHKASLNEEGQQYMEYIVEASIRMEKLINDLLNYSRLGRKAVDLRPIPLSLIIKNIHNDYKNKLDEIGGKIIIDANLPTINGDESLLRQIFTNLIGNAITYRQDKKPLEININSKIVENKIQIMVGDNGIGIPKEHWEKIFNIFQRLHSDDKYPGTGIGLSTVKKAVTLLNGKIWLESEVGLGTTFILEFDQTNNS